MQFSVELISRKMGALPTSGNESFVLPVSRVLAPSSSPPHALSPSLLTLPPASNLHWILADISLRRIRTDEVFYPLASRVDHVCPLRNGKAHKITRPELLLLDLLLIPRVEPSVEGLAGRRRGEEEKGSAAFQDVDPFFGVAVRVQLLLRQQNAPQRWAQLWIT